MLILTPNNLYQIINWMLVIKMIKLKKNNIIKNKTVAASNKLSTILKIGNIAVSSISHDNQIIMYPIRSLLDRISSPASPSKLQ